MFFKSAAFKRLVNEAYKGPGLTIGHDTGPEDEDKEGYYLSGGYWIIWIAKEWFTKKEKAAVIELCGDLPEPGEVFKAMKDYGNQYEIEQSEMYHLPEKFKQCHCYFDVTKLTMQQDTRNIRFLQETERHHVTAIGDVFMNLIDPKSIDYNNGETEPRGPVAERPEAPFLYWGNETCFLMACIRTTTDEAELKFWKFLEGTKIL